MSPDFVARNRQLMVYTNHGHIGQASMFHENIFEAGKTFLAETVGMANFS